LSKQLLQKFTFKQIRIYRCYMLKYSTMTKPANSSDKPSPSDTPTERPADNGHKAMRHETDKEYQADEPHGGNIAKKHEKEEQPVDPIKNPPAGNGAQKGKVQPD
jgi:hypothetical protein